jgi:hypothetical protein
MNYVPRRFRLASHVGKVRQRLAAKLIKAFAEQGLELRVDPAKLCPAQGAWRTDTRLDVFRWEGWGEVKMHDRWQNCSINSWDPMTRCLRGLTIEREAVYTFLVSANGPTPQT